MDFPAFPTFKIIESNCVEGVSRMISIAGQLPTVFVGGLLVPELGKVYLDVSESLVGCHSYNLEGYPRNEIESVDYMKTMDLSVSQLLHL